MKIMTRVAIRRLLCFIWASTLARWHASLIVGGVGEIYGWGYGFALAGIGLLTGFVVFVKNKAHLMGQAESAHPELLEQKVWGLRRETLIYVLALVGVVVVQQVLQTKFDFDAIAHILGMAPGTQITATEVVAIVLTIALLVWWFKFIFIECSAIERANMIVLMVLNCDFCGILGSLRANLRHLAGLFRSGHEH